MPRDAFAQMDALGHGGGRISAPALVSLVLHAGILALIVHAVPPPMPEEEPRHLLVELRPEAPPPVIAAAEVVRPQPAPIPTLVPNPAPVRRISAAPLRPARQRPAAAAPVSSAPPSASGEAAPPSVEPVRDSAAPAAVPSLGESAPAPEAEPADYRAYALRLHDRIARYRIYPSQALRRHEEGDVRLRVLLGQDGRLLSILNLAEASFHLTEAARQAVASAAPFEPPPSTGEAGRQMAFDVTVAFRIR